jgi:hypothetical protein
MDLFTCFNWDISKNQIKMVYNWRLYLQVELISDLMNATGDRILDVYLKYPTAPSIKDIYSDRISKHMWQNQPPPLSKASFAIWTKCICKCFRLDGKKLCPSLGEWLHSPSELQSKWNYYIDPTYTCLI